MNYEYSHEDFSHILNYLKERVSIEPKIGIICGSGLGSLADSLTNIQMFDYKDIPFFPISTVIGHPGRLIFGYIAKTPVICMQGRFHFYEGNSLQTCVMPIRLMKLLGVTTLILSNAAGGINPSYKVGDIMLIKDHINFVGLPGMNPLRGKNDDSVGPRFVPLNDAYDPELITLAKNLGLEGFHEGIYGCVGGPNYETVAEIKMMKMLGVDAVGMSTVHEVIAAKHCGLRCFAFSLITNKCVENYNTDEKPNGEEVVEVANKKKEEMKIFIENFVTKLDIK